MHKNLPHLNLKGFYQFITFRTKKSVDSYVKKIQSQNLDKSKKECLVDMYLDNSKNGAYFFKDNISMLKDILLEKNN